MDKRAISCTPEDLSGHMNHDYTAPFNPNKFKNPGPTDNIRGIEENTARGVKKPLVIQDVTGERLDGSNLPLTPGFPGYRAKDV